MTTKTSASKVGPGRPSEATPDGGVLYTDTPEFAHYAELRRIRNWHEAFLDDVEHLRISSAEAIKRIDEFEASLPASFKQDNLSRIRASLSGNAEIHLGTQLTNLRRVTRHHWGYSVSCAAQNCERVPNGQERPYDGPLPRQQQSTGAYRHTLQAGHTVAVGAPNRGGAQ